MRGVPTESDWENYQDDLDASYAHKIFFGKTNDEMQKRFKGSILGRVEDLRSMPRVPFQYYIFGLRDFVMARDFNLLDSSDAASCFLDLLLQKIEEQPAYVITLIKELAPDINFVADNQELYKAPENIYGNFPSKRDRIFELAQYHER